VNIRIPAIGVAAFCAAWLLSATTAPSSAQTKPTPCPVGPTPAPIVSKGAGKIGEIVKAEKFTIQVNKLERGKTYGSLGKPKDSANELIAIDFTLQSTADKEVGAYLSRARLRDSDGFEYEATSFGKDPTLKSQNDVPSGQKRRGWVTFEIPKTAKGLVFAYEAVPFKPAAETLLGQ
jgi:hypothetical protein